MKTDRIEIIKVSDASFFVEDLFRAAFGQPPPTTPVHYVAFAHVEPLLFKAVGYYHVTYGEEYGLAGGLCVDPAYRNRGLGEKLAAIVFGDAGAKKAFFTYTGHPTSAAIARRVGYQNTAQPHLMVKWMKILPEEEQERLIQEVAALGPF